MPPSSTASCAYSRRVGNGDVEALVLMVGLADEIDTAIAEAVRACTGAATLGPRSAPGSASPARLPNNDGASPGSTSPGPVWPTRRAHHSY